MTKLSEADSRVLWDVANGLADAARAHTLRWFRHSDLSVESKDVNFDPVTQGDRDAEAAMRAYLNDHRPMDGILGEEFGHQEGRSGLTWVLDPIDGTRGFMSGTPTWGTLIALSDERGPILGVVDQPYIGERFCGGLGRSEMVRAGAGVTVPLNSRTTSRLADAVIFTTFPEVGSETERAAFQDLAAQTKLTRYGMDCYAYALLAAGQIDLVVEAGLHTYDIQAPIALIEAAGGIVTDWTGGPAHQGGRALAAANEDIHAAALSVLRAQVS